MMNGSLVSDTSPSSTVTGVSLSAALSWARAAPGHANVHAASTRAAMARAATKPFARIRKRIAFLLQTSRLSDRIALCTLSHFRTETGFDPPFARACTHLRDWPHGGFQGRTASHSFSPRGRRWDEGAPAVRYGIIVPPSPHPLPFGARE